MKRPLFIAILFLISLFITTSAFAYIIKGFEREIDTVDIKIDSKHYVLLIDVCSANGIEWEWDSISRKVSLRKNGHEVCLLLGSRYYAIDEKIKKLSAPAWIKDGNVYVPLKFAKSTIKQLFDLHKKPSRILTKKAVYEKRAVKPKRPSERRYTIKKIVIDPGHGGKDPGAVGRTGLKEKDVVLDVAGRIKKELEKKGIAVVMTRNSDKFIPLSERTKIANEKGADLFVSIHANANKARWLRGFEVYHLSEATDDNARALATAENSVLEYEKDSFAKHTRNLDAIVWDLKFTEERVESIELAEVICREVSKRLKLKRNKVRSARFYVLKGTKMPAVLIELSYLSNRWDEKNMKKSYYKEKLAKGIAAGLTSYKDKYERTNGFSR